MAEVSVIRVATAPDRAPAGLPDDITSALREAWVRGYDHVEVIKAVKDGATTLRIAPPDGDHQDEGDLVEDEPTEVAKASDDEPAEHAGVMVALFPDVIVAELPLPDGEPATELHVTLGYIGKLPLDASRQLAILQAATALGLRAQPLAGQVSGVGRFHNDDEDGHAVWAALDIPGLSRMRAALVEHLHEVGVELDGTHDFTPHMTLAYVAPDAPTPDVPGVGASLRFTKLTVCFGPTRIPVPLGDPGGHSADALNFALSVMTDFRALQANTPQVVDIDKDESAPAPSGPTATSAHVDSVNWRPRTPREPGPQAAYTAMTKADARRFTLGPWYVPDLQDAHGEWADADTLQAALHEYVRAGDRTVYLQHNMAVPAGEWVEALTWPHPVTVPMTAADSTSRDVSFPAGTVFLGVIWEPWAWLLVLAGKVAGFSIGGKALRVGDGPAVVMDVEGADNLAKVTE